MYLYNVQKSVQFGSGIEDPPIKRAAPIHEKVEVLASDRRPYPLSVEFLTL